MIGEHQPKNLPKDLIVALSSVEDGTMKYATHTPEAEVRTNRVGFLAQKAIEMSHTNLIRIAYDSNDYCRYGKAEIDSQGISMESWHDTDPLDGMMTDQSERAIFLPVADCCPMVVADTESQAFMVSHLGRHNVEQFGGRKSIEALCETYGISPDTLRVWLGPMVGRETYPLSAFDGQGLEEVILEQLAQAGISDGQIESSGIDTATNPHYFSHSEFKKGRRELDGRFAVVAMRSPA